MCVVEDVGDFAGYGLVGGDAGGQLGVVGDGGLESLRKGRGVYVGEVVELTLVDGEVGVYGMGCGVFGVLVVGGGVEVAVERVGVGEAVGGVL